MCELIVGPIGPRYLDKHHLDTVMLFNILNFVISEIRLKLNQGKSNVCPIRMRMVKFCLGFRSTLELFRHIEMEIIGNRKTLGRNTPL